jgi:hypothetical protein
MVKHGTAALRRGRAGERCVRDPPDLLSHDRVLLMAPGRASGRAPGARYPTCSALSKASIVLSTIRRTVVSNELSAPPPVIASATAAMDTLSGASRRL